MDLIPYYLPPLVQKWYQNSYDIENIEAVNREISKDLCDMRKHSAVSDIFVLQVEKSLDVPVTV